VVAQLSDLHVGRGSPDGRVIAAVRRVNAAKPDLVVLTGDYVTWKGDPVGRVPELLQPLVGPVVATMGNHDHWVDVSGLRRGLDKLGHVVLQNQHTVLTVKGAPLTVLGVDDAHTRHDDVAATFRGAPRDGTRLVLAHTPTTIRKLPPDDGLVCLSGHTHGGQIWLPGLTKALFTAGGQPYIRGRYVVNGNQLYVNRGLGFGRGTPNPRIGSEPEVSFFTLRRAI
jgi:predicted MPP superfamily phosphohydrolase